MQRVTSGVRLPLPEQKENGTKWREVLSLLPLITPDEKGDLSQLRKTCKHLKIKPWRSVDTDRKWSVSQINSLMRKALLTPVLEATNELLEALNQKSMTVDMSSDWACDRMFEKLLSGYVALCNQISTLLGVSLNRSKHKHTRALVRYIWKTCLRELKLDLLAHTQRKHLIPYKINTIVRDISLYMRQGKAPLAYSEGSLNYVITPDSVIVCQGVLLGQGIFKKVYLGKRVKIDFTIEEVAFAIVRARLWELQDNAQLFDSPYVTKTSTLARNKTTGQTVLIMPKATGNLEDAIKDDRLSKKDILQIVIDAAKGLVHIHKRGYVHRDIKEQNVVYTIKGTGQLTDLDDVCKIGERSLHHSEGCAAEEDIWAFGRMLGALLKEGAFGSKSMCTLLNSVLQDRIFSENPQERPDAEELVTILEGVYGQCTNSVPVERKEVS